MKTVRKVFAYLIRDNKILVFKHLDHPDAGIQVPAGTVEENESIEHAILREVEEETNLSKCKIVQFLGEKEFYSEKYNELHIRHFFELSSDDPKFYLETWQHGETKSDFHMTEIDRQYGMIRYSFFWLSKHEASQSLVYQHGDFLDFVLND